MQERTHKQALPPGFRLQNYRIVRVLGVGGFGVTNLAEDETLDRCVAVKEYLPNEFAAREGTTVYPKSEADRRDFDWGLKRFLDEARTLAKFRYPNLIRVVGYFEANNTAYLVMDYEEGESLDRLLERHRNLTEAQLKGLLLPIVDGLREVRRAGYLHRDIKPSNVYVRRSDESPVLLDFGAARHGRMAIVRSAFCAVVPGATYRTFSVRRSASRYPHPTGANLPVSEWLGRLLVDCFPLCLVGVCYEAMQVRASGGMHRESGRSCAPSFIRRIGVDDQRQIKKAGLRADRF